MHYHILLTERCNSQCKYCYEKSMKEENDLDKRFKFDFSLPCQSKVDVKELARFLEKDSEAVLIFYGGEPLLEIEKIKEILDSIKVKFRMQTNGLLLDKIPIDYLNKIDKILISLDGNKKRTDENRGNGTYEKVMENIKKVREGGYKGEIIARMVVSPDYLDFYEQIKHLMNTGFDKIHWQIDAGFYNNDYEEEKIKDFFESYNKDVSKLVEEWTKELENGRVVRFYPFLGIVNRLLGFDKNIGLQCGAGNTGYAIDTRGNVIACPIMNCITDFKAGDLKSNPNQLKKFEIEECNQCNVKNICGGRCLYWRKAKLWPKQGDEQICNSIKHLIKELEKNTPRIKKALESGKISKADLEYERYFGPEIVP